MSNIKINNNIPNPKKSKTSRKLISHINSNIKLLKPEEFKNFFKKYHQNKNKSNNPSESETDSYMNDIPENKNELNSIYLTNLNNLNNFLQKSKNLKGVTLRGNKLLENISLDKFNEFFREYGKSIEKKLKKHVLNYFYPHDNTPKLMGPKMNLTPIPVKRNIYIKNEKEKKDYKNAERAAVILRRLEYTHGLGDKRNHSQKIIFYLMKGAALIIEDWWIKVYNQKKKKDNYSTLLGKIKNLNQDNNNYINYLKKNKKINYRSKSTLKENKNKYQVKPELNEKKEIKRKPKKIKIIEINLDEEQQKIIPTEPRNSAPINTNHKSKKHKKLNSVSNQYGDNKLKKSASFKNIYDKVKEIKKNSIKFMKNKFIIRNMKNKDNNKDYNIVKGNNKNYNDNKENSKDYNIDKENNRYSNIVKENNKDYNADKENNDDIVDNENNIDNNVDKENNDDEKENNKIEYINNYMNLDKDQFVRNKNINIKEKSKGKENKKNNNEVKNDNMNENELDNNIENNTDRYSNINNINKNNIIKPHLNVSKSSDSNNNINIFPSLGKLNNYNNNKKNKKFYPKKSTSSSKKNRSASTKNDYKIDLINNNFNNIKTNKLFPKDFSKVKNSKISNNNNILNSAQLFDKKKGQNSKVKAKKIDLIPEPRESKKKEKGKKIKDEENNKGNELIISNIEQKEEKEEKKDENIKINNNKFDNDNDNYSNNKKDIYINDINNNIDSNMNTNKYIKENNISMSIINEESKNKNRSSKLNINISDDKMYQINNKVKSKKENYKKENIDEKYNNKDSINNNINNNIDSSKKNNSINIVSIIGYKLDNNDFDNEIMNSVNKIKNEENKSKIIEGNSNINNEENNKINESENNISEKENNKNIDYKEDIEDKNNCINNEKVNKAKNNNNINNKEDIESTNNNKNNININNIKKEKNKNFEENQKGDNNNNKINFNDNNVLIHINESNNFIKDNSDIQDNISKKSKKSLSVPKANSKGNTSKNSFELDDSKMKLKRNSFFFNNLNNVLLVNIDNNAEYDETEIKKIDLKKKSYYAKYTTNMIKININDINYDIINHKKEKEENDIEGDKISLTERNPKRLSNSVENKINLQDGSNSDRDKKLFNENQKHKIYYKIFKNKQKIPPSLGEKTSMDGSVDEIISNQLRKIHDNNDEKNKERINSIYNNIQIRKSQNLNYNIYNNFEKPDTDNNNSRGKIKLKKSKSLENLSKENNIDINKK